MIEVIFQSKTDICYVVDIANSKIKIVDDLISVTPLTNEVVLKTSAIKHTIPRGNFESVLVAIGFDLASHVIELVEAARRETLTWLTTRKTSSGSLQDLQVSKHKLAKIYSDIAVARSFIQNQRQESFPSYLSFHLMLIACMKDLSDSFDVCVKLNGGRGYLTENWYAATNDFIRKNRTGLSIARKYIDATESNLLMLL